MPTPTALYRSLPCVATYFLGGAGLGIFNVHEPLNTICSSPCISRWRPHAQLDVQWRRFSRAVQGFRQRGRGHPVV